MKFDEGATLSGDIGDYGPYTQSERIDIYHTFAKELDKKGLCYPCFCSEEDIDEIRRKQQETGMDTIGYYGEWAKCRDLSYEEIERKCSELDPPENIRDEIVIKSDGLPTYHFAHVVDDHLMKTTHVVRGEDWLPSLPTHIQLFEAMGWNPPHYLHTANLMKQDGASKRKLSKRKDPENALSYYQEQGIFPEAAIEYLMIILNSNFEEWRMENPTGLNDVSKDIIAKFKADEIYDRALAWAKKFDAELYNILHADKEKVIAILNIGRNDPKPRKDIASLSQIKDYIAYFFDELFNPDYTLPQNVNKEDAVKILSQYKGIYNENDDQAEWFNRIRGLAAENNFAEMKAYKKNPSEYKGHVGDVSGIIRAAVCGRANTPDMHAIFRIMTKRMIIKELTARLNIIPNKLNDLIIPPIYEI
ncbi:glutamate--trna ligase [Holotrichia oblita]|nr:glutamate--trna ligase [Holotrichia oblita]